MYEEGYWTTKYQEILKISEMETSHIKNTIKYLKRNPDFFSEYGGCWFMDDEPYFDDKKELAIKKIHELEAELMIRRDYMKYKVGDKVRVRRDFKDRNEYIIRTNKDMESYIGHELTIISVSEHYYEVKQNPWVWTDDMLEDLITKTFKENMYVYKSEGLNEKVI